MITTFFSIIPIFLLIITGFVTQRFFIKDESFWKKVDKLVYYLFFPALLILELNKADFSGSVVNGIAATSISTLLIGLAVFLAKKTINDNKLFTSVFQGAIRYNSYIFLAISSALYDSSGVALAGVFIAYMIVLTNIMSILVMNIYGKGDKKEYSYIAVSIFKNPLILAVLIGIILRLIDLDISGFIAVILNYLGSAASPLSLMSIGAGLLMLIERKVVISMSYSIILKLIAMPVVTSILIYYLNVDGLTGSIALLYSAVPCAGNAYILSRQMGGDSVAMASIITWGTLLSIITIPLSLNFLS